MPTTSHYCSLSELTRTSRSPDFAVCFDDDHIKTWQELTHDTQFLIGFLEQNHYQKIALCTQDSYLFTCMFLASVITQKHIVLPGNVQPAALDELSEQFDCLMVDDSVATIPNEKISIFNISALLETKEFANPIEFFPLNQELSLNLVKLTLFTSGSSGAPKAIQKTLVHIENEINELEATWGKLLDNSQVQSTVSHQHIYGLLFRVLWPLCAGRAFARHNLDYPEQIMTHATKETTLISSPALLKRMTTEYSPKHIRCVFSSGGPLSFDSAQQSNQLLGSLPIEVYGSTETGGIAFRQQWDTSTPWQLFDCIEAALNSEKCLKLISPYIDKFNWYQTADECEMVSDSQFILKGRTDRIIKIEEKRVSLVEVEKRLEQLPWIDECVVIPLEEPERLILASVIVLSNEGRSKFDTMSKGKFWLLLRSELRNWLEPIAIPRRYRILDEIPLNSQGKRLISEIEQHIKQ